VGSNAEVFHPPSDHREFDLKRASLPGLVRLWVSPAVLTLVLGLLGDRQLFLAAVISSPLALVGFGFLVSLGWSVSKDFELNGVEGISEPEPVSDRKVLFGRITWFGLIGL